MVMCQRRSRDTAALGNMPLVLRGVSFAPVAELQVQAAGLGDGCPATMQLTVAHPDGCGLTAIPVVATLLQYQGGS
jgi:hypothetical protein